MSGLTPQFFDTFIIVIMLVGLALAAVRFYREMTRPLPPERPPLNPALRMQPPVPNPRKEDHP